MEMLHQTGEIVAERYRILNPIGQGGSSITYEADGLCLTQPEKEWLVGELQEFLKKLPTALAPKALK